jgi:hypothetical protein
MTAPPSAPTPAPIVDLSFPHHWQAEILPSRPLILPKRHFVYPREAEEVELGALEVLVRPGTPATEPFLATCALGFRDPAVPSGMWSAPNPEDICAVSGGYAYMIRTTDPERFTMMSYRPVLEIRALPAQDLLLFVGHHSILAWGANGQAWQSEKLSDEGVTITHVEEAVLHGMGWNIVKDKETPFALESKTGRSLT